MFLCSTTRLIAFNSLKICCCLVCAVAVPPHEKSHDTQCFELKPITHDILLESCLRSSSKVWVGFTGPSPKRQRRQSLNAFCRHHGAFQCRRRSSSSSNSGSKNRFCSWQHKAGTWRVPGDTTDRYVVEVHPAMKFLSFTENGSSGGSCQSRCRKAR